MTPVDAETDSFLGCDPMQRMHSAEICLVERRPLLWFRQAFEHNRGIRIDHFLLQSSLADRLVSCEIDRVPRAQKKPSDPDYRQAAMIHMLLGRDLVTSFNLGSLPTSLLASRPLEVRLIDGKLQVDVDA